MIILPTFRSRGYHGASERFNPGQLGWKYSHQRYNDVERDDLKTQRQWWQQWRLTDLFVETGVPDIWGSSSRWHVPIQEWRSSHCFHGAKQEDQLRAWGQIARTCGTDRVGWMDDARSMSTFFNSYWDFQTIPFFPFVKYLRVKMILIYFAFGFWSPIR